MSLVALLALSLVPQAEALSCLEGPDAPLPADGAVDVPTDVQVRVAMHWADTDTYSLHLLDELGQEVAATLEMVENPGSSDLAWVRPDAELSPNSSYSLHAGMNEQIWDDWALTTFTTGSAAQSDSPEAPAVLSVERDRGTDIWGSWDWLRIEVDSAAPASFLIEVATDETFSDARQAHVTEWNGGEGELELLVGDGLCGGNMPLLDGERWVRVAAVDYAGNISDFAAAEAPAGCSSAGGPASGLAGVLGFFLVALGRRRR